MVVAGTAGYSRIYWILGSMMPAIVTACSAGWARTGDQAAGLVAAAPRPNPARVAVSHITTADNTSVPLGFPPKLKLMQID